jgi:hypothetical protein
MFRLFIIFGFLMSVVVLANSYESVLPRFKPDISLGQSIYTQSCSQCHSSTAFVDPSWKAELTPARVVLNLSTSSHTDLELESLWHAVAYTWTQSSNGSEIKHGEALALEAQKRMEKDALWLLLTKGQDLMNLQSRDWVLSHTKEDIRSLIVNLAGDSYTTLSATDQEALVNYIYASYFMWPETWK